MGVSMGGYGALKIAFKHPDRFGVVAAHSAAILSEDPERLEAEYPWLRGRGKALVAQVFGEPLDLDKWRGENVLVLAEESPLESLRGLDIYFDCGDEDRYGFQTANRRLHEILERREVPHTWQLVEGGGHGWRSGYNLAQLPQSLEFVAAQLAAVQGRAGLEGLLIPGDAAGTEPTPADEPR
jgi:S-formylglutathione hydrolase FrmB